MAGDKITTSDFIATVPASWSCDGDDGDISLSSTRDDAIWVEHDTGQGSVDDCTSQIDGMGTVSALPQEKWGGVTARAYQAVDSGDIYGVRCAVVGSQTWYLMYFSLDSKDDAAVRADVTKVVTPGSGVVAEETLIRAPRRRAETTLTRVACEGEYP